MDRMPLLGILPRCYLLNTNHHCHFLNKKRTFRETSTVFVLIGEY